MTRSLKNDQLARYGFGPEAMGKTRLCPACDTLVTDGAKVCPVCAQALPELTLLTWYAQQHPQCDHCGTILRGNSRYCPRCGRLQRNRSLQTGGNSQPEYQNRKEKNHYGID